MGDHARWDHQNAQEQKRRGPMGGRIGSCRPWQNLRRISKVCSGGVALLLLLPPQKNFFIGCKHATNRPLPAGKAEDGDVGCV